MNGRYVFPPSVDFQVTTLVMISVSGSFGWTCGTASSIRPAGRGSLVAFAHESPPSSDR
jgi:hypothetical protein